MVFSTLPQIVGVVALICHNCQHVTCPECGLEHAECPRCNFDRIAAEVMRDFAPTLEKLAHSERLELGSSEEGGE